MSTYTLEARGPCGIGTYPGFATRDEAHEYFRLRLKPWGQEFIRIYEDRTHALATTDGEG